MQLLYDLDTVVSSRAVAKATTLFDHPNIADYTCTMMVPSPLSSAFESSEFAGGLASTSVIGLQKLCHLINLSGH